MSTNYPADTPLVVAVFYGKLVYVLAVKLFSYHIVDILSAVKLDRKGYLLAAIFGIYFYHIFITDKLANFSIYYI